MNERARLLAARDKAERAFDKKRHESLKAECVWRAALKALVVYDKEEAQ